MASNSHQSSFSGVHAKVKRANEHLNSLAPLIQSLVDSGANNLVVEKYPNGKGFLIRSEFLWPPPPYWGSIIGDIVHNLRSALDILACELVAANGSIPTSQTAFPVLRTNSGSERDWHSCVGGKLKGASSEAIEFVQALNCYAEGTDRFKVYMLDQLDIYDKHRMLIPVLGGFPETVNVTSAHVSASPSPTIHAEYTVTDAIFPPEEHGDFLTILPHAGNDVNDYLKRDFRVTFREPPIVSSQPVLPTLMELGNLTQSLVSELSTLVRTS